MEMVIYRNNIGQKHREDGPSVIWESGREEWYLDGKSYYYEDWLKRIPNNISYKWKEYNV